MSGLEVMAAVICAFFVIGFAVGMLLVSALPEGRRRRPERKGRRKR